MQIDAGGNRKTLCEAVKRNKLASTNGFPGAKKNKNKKHFERGTRRGNISEQLFTKQN